MKLRHITSAVALAAVCVTGASFAQTRPTTPSTTPNDGSGVPPNTAVPPGQAAPPPTRATTPGPVTTTPTHPRSDGGVGKAPSDAGNTNVSPIQGGGPPYEPIKNK
jgi:hypothetical protein